MNLCYHFSKNTFTEMPNSGLNKDLKKNKPIYIHESIIRQQKG